MFSDSYLMLLDIGAVIVSLSTTSIRTEIIEI